MTSLPIAIGREAPHAASTDVLEAARAYSDADTSAATQRAYAGAWRDFEAWCLGYDTPPLPALPGAVAAYLASLADRKLSASTIDQRAAAIAWTHRRAGHTPPTGDEVVKRVQRGIRRTIGTAQHGKSPATAEVVRKLLKALLRDAGATLAGLRDQALMLVGFAGALRRSELVALTVEDLERTPEGIVVTICRSKTDQEGAGQTVSIPLGRKLRPVAALEAWLDAAGITTGPVFRPVNKGGGVGAEALTPQSVALVIKRWAGAAKLDPKLFAGHSLRSGLITQALLDEIDVLQIMDVSRHTEVKTLKKYDRRAKSFKQHAGRKSL